MKQKSFAASLRTVFVDLCVHHVLSFSIYGSVNSPSSAKVSATKWQDQQPGPVYFFLGKPMFFQKEVPKSLASSRVPRENITCGQISCACSWDMDVGKPPLTLLRKPHLVFHLRCFSQHTHNIPQYTSIYHHNPS